MFGTSAVRSGATSEPTSALPGSEEKIRVLTERASRREPLFHPLDGRIGAPAVRLAEVTSPDGDLDPSEEITDDGEGVEAMPALEPVG